MQKTFDFFKFVQDSRAEITVKPAMEGAVARIEVRDPATGYYAEATVSQSDIIEGRLADKAQRLLSDVLIRKNRLYDSRKERSRKAEKRREMEKFWRESTPSKLTEGKA